MKLFARGEGQKIRTADEAADFGSGTDVYGRVVGVADLGGNNSENVYGWTGIKAVVHSKGENFVLDFPHEVTIQTDDGVEFISKDDHSWWPSLEDCSRYGLYLFRLKRIEQ